MQGSIGDPKVPSESHDPGDAFARRTPHVGSEVDLEPQAMKFTIIRKLRGHACAAHAVAVRAGAGGSQSEALPYPRG